MPDGFVRLSCICSRLCRNDTWHFSAKPLTPHSAQEMFGAIGASQDDINNASEFASPLSLRTLQVRAASLLISQRVSSARLVSRARFFVPACSVVALGLTYADLCAARLRAIMPIEIYICRRRSDASSSAPSGHSDDVASAARAEESFVRRALEVVAAAVPRIAAVVVCAASDAPARALRWPSVAIATDAADAVDAVDNVAADGDDNAYYGCASALSAAALATVRWSTGDASSAARPRTPVWIVLGGT